MKEDPQTESSSGVWELFSYLVELHFLIAHRRKEMGKVFVDVS